MKWIIATEWSPILGAINTFESGLSQTLRLIALLAYALAFIVIIIAGWQYKNGNPDQAKAALLGAAIIALAATIATALFSAGGLPTINIGR